MARKDMEFKKLKTDDLALMADLMSREAGNRSADLVAALRRIEKVEEGRYGRGRPDVRLTIALAPGLEAVVDNRWSDRDASASELADSIVELIDSANRIFEDRDCTIEMLKEVRSALSREIAKARRRGLPYRTLDVTLTPSAAGSDDLPAPLVGLELIDPLLDAGRIEFHAESAEDVVRAFADMREEQEQRLAMRQRLAQVGADVMFDAVTLAALEDAGIAPADAIGAMRNSDIPIIDLDVRHGRMVLYVRESVVTGNTPLGDGMRWQENRLTVPKSRGLSFADVKGKPLNQVVSHDYFDDQLVVFYASELSDSAWVHVLPRPVAVCLREVRNAA